MEMAESPLLDVSQVNFTKAVLDLHRDAKKKGKISPEDQLKQLVNLVQQLESVSDVEAKNAAPKLGGLARKLLENKNLNSQFIESTCRTHAQGLLGLVATLLDMNKLSDTMPLIQAFITREILPRNDKNLAGLWIRSSTALMKDPVSGYNYLQDAANLGVAWKDAPPEPLNDFCEKLASFFPCQLDETTSRWVLEVMTVSKTTSSQQNKFTAQLLPFLQAQKPVDYKRMFNTLIIHGDLDLLKPDLETVLRAYIADKCPWTAVSLLCRVLEYPQPLLDEGVLSDMIEQVGPKLRDSAPSHIIKNYLRLLTLPKTVTLFDGEKGKEIHFNMLLNRLDRVSALPLEFKELYLETLLSRWNAVDVANIPADRLILILDLLTAFEPMPKEWESGVSMLANAVIASGSTDAAEKMLSCLVKTPGYEKLSMDLLKAVPSVSGTCWGNVYTYVLKTPQEGTTVQAYDLLLACGKTLADRNQVADLWTKVALSLSTIKPLKIIEILKLDPSEMSGGFFATADNHPALQALFFEYLLVGVMELAMVHPNAKQGAAMLMRVDTIKTMLTPLLSRMECVHTRCVLELFLSAQECGSGESLIVEAGIRQILMTTSLMKILTGSPEIITREWPNLVTQLYELSGLHIESTPDHVNHVAADTLEILSRKCTMLFESPLMTHALIALGTGLRENSSIVEGMSEVLRDIWKITSISNAPRHALLSLAADLAAVGHTKHLSSSAVILADVLAYGQGDDNLVACLGNRFYPFLITLGAYPETAQITTTLFKLPFARSFTEFEQAQFWDGSIHTVLDKTKMDPKRLVSFFQLLTAATSDIMKHCSSKDNPIPKSIIEGMKTYAILIAIEDKDSSEGFRTARSEFLESLPESWYKGGALPRNKQLRDKIDYSFYFTLLNYILECAGAKPESQARVFIECGKLLNRCLELQIEPTNKDYKHLSQVVDAYIIFWLINQADLKLVSKDVTGFSVLQLAMAKGLFRDSPNEAMHWKLMLMEAMPKGHKYSAPALAELYRDTILRAIALKAPRTLKTAITLADQTIADKRMTQQADVFVPCFGPILAAMRQFPTTNIDGGFGSLKILPLRRVWHKNLTIEQKQLMQDEHVSVQEDEWAEFEKKFITKSESGRVVIEHAQEVPKIADARKETLEYGIGNGLYAGRLDDLLGAIASLCRVYTRLVSSAFRPQDQRNTDIIELLFYVSSQFEFSEKQKEERVLIVNSWLKLLILVGEKGKQKIAQSLYESVKNAKWYDGLPDFQSDAERILKETDATE